MSVSTSVRRYGGGEREGRNITPGALKTHQKERESLEPPLYTSPYRTDARVPTECPSYRRSVPTTICNAELDVTGVSLDAAVRQVAHHYEGERGEFAYRAFDWINGELFAGELPTPLIVWTITAHGRCLGLTRSSKRPPKIILHPSTLGGTEKPDPWGLRPDLLGWAYAFDVLVHECIHVSVAYRLGGAKGPTSHNNPQWLAEVERLAPLLGLEGLRVARSKTKRVRLEDGRSVVRRECSASVPYKALATFPYGVHKALGELDHYRDNRLPFAWEGCNAVLGVTE
jgi:hypothetical protein